MSAISVDNAVLLSMGEYFPFGGARKWLWANGETYERAFDLDGRVKTLTLGPSGGTYADLSQSFGYDSLNRLTTASLAAGQTQSYAYDANGNRTNATINAASTNYTYLGTSHKLSSLSGATTRSFTYDNAGNVTASAGVTYVYDGRGRMKQAGSTTYLVNGLGRRVRKNTGSDRFFAYDEAGRLIGEYDAAGAAIQETVWLGDIPVATIRPKQPSGYDVFTVWTDNLNALRAVSDAANQSRWTWEPNDPFGKAAANEYPASLGVFNFNPRFPGQYYDVETGLHYSYFRDYDPTIGRYVQSDPIGMRGGANAYAYVSSRPLQAIDRLGLSEADMRHVWRQMLGKFPDLNPNGNPSCGPVPAGASAYTSANSGAIVVPQKYCDKACLTKDEWNELFWSLFHEGMHSSDSFLRRKADGFGDMFNYSTDNHDSIYLRGVWEQFGNGKGVPPRPNMWGRPRPNPVDIDARYREYRQRTPQCCQN